MPKELLEQNMNNDKLKELAEKICNLTGYGQALHPNDILPELEAAYLQGRTDEKLRIEKLLNDHEIPYADLTEEQKVYNEAVDDILGTISKL